MSFPFEFELTPEQREREGVERRELSRLFVAYAQRAADGCLGTGWTAFAPLLDPAPREWRRLAVRYLEVLAREGRECVGTDLLRALLARRGKPEHSGLDPVELMVAAVRIWPSPEGYLGLGQMLMARGRMEEGREVYGFLMRSMSLAEDEHHGWRVREGLGVAWEACGQRRLALGCFERGALRRNAGIGPLVAAWPLAVELGQVERAGRVADALDQRVGWSGRKLERCVEGLLARRGRLQPVDGDAPWLPPEQSADEVRRVLARGRAMARVCQALLGREVR